MAKNAAGKSRERCEIRFTNNEHHKLVRKAAKASGTTMNAWLIRVTLDAARRELAKLES